MAEDKVWVPSTLQPEGLIEAREDMLTAQRLVRYWWAWCVAKRMKATLIYDMGCGCGYGCRIMAEQQPHELRIVGVDKDEAALKMFTEKYDTEEAPDGISFQRMDFDMEWVDRFNSQKPQLITCFEVFEELAHRDLFLAGLAEVLHDEGTLLLAASGLAGHTTTRGVRPMLVTYSKMDLEAMLKRFFGDVTTVLDAKFPSQDYIDGINNKLDGTAANLMGGELFACSKPIRA